MHYNICILVTLLRVTQKFIQPKSITMSKINDLHEMLFMLWVQENGHAWFIYFSSTLVTCCWIGLAGSLVALLFGVSYWWKVLVATVLFFFITRGITTFGMSWLYDSYLDRNRNK